MRVLWVDDHPDNNIIETRLFRSLGMIIDQVTTTDEALEKLRTTKYDAIIFAIARASDTRSGIKFLAEIWNQKLYCWTILYMGSVGVSKETPAYAFGMTARPDHLLHYMIDIGERERL